MADACLHADLDQLQRAVNSPSPRAALEACEQVRTSCAGALEAQLLERTDPGAPVRRSGGTGGIDARYACSVERV